MSDLQGLTKRSTIRFPNPLDQNHIEDYFKYLGENYIKVDYTIEIKIKREKINPKENLNERYISKINGTLSTSESTHSSGQFECLLKDPGLDELIYSPRIYELNFSLMARDELRDFHKEEIQLWDKVRNLTQEYFLKNQR